MMVLRRLRTGRNRDRSLAELWSTLVVEVTIGASGADTSSQLRAVSCTQEIREIRQVSNLMGREMICRRDLAFAVDPDDWNLKLASWDHVVKIALCSVKQAPVAGSAEALGEVRMTWFIGSHLLSSHD